MEKDRERDSLARKKRRKSERETNTDRYIQIEQEYGRERGRREEMEIGEGEA